MPVSSFLSRLRSLYCSGAKTATTSPQATSNQPQTLNRTLNRTPNRTPNHAPSRTLNRKLTRNLAWVGAWVGLLAVGATSAPAIADRSQEAYQTCSADLLAGNIDPEAVALACATAYKPLDLAACVTEIDAGTDIAPDEALGACREVRRPRDLSNCTVRIDDAFSPTNPLAVMDSCRRSLLPIEFANCAIGETAEIEMTVDTAMATCLDANDRVRDVFPTFIPTR